MSQNHTAPDIGLLPPPPLLPSQMLPMPPRPPTQQLPPPLPMPAPVYQAVMPSQVYGGFPPMPYQSVAPSLPGYPNQLPFQTNAQGSGATQFAIPAMTYATVQAASQMMIGSMLGLSQFTQHKRHKRRSLSPKRRHRSRSESPVSKYRRSRSPDRKRERERERERTNGKRKRNRSPQYKPSRHAGSKTDSDSRNSGSKTDSDVPQDVVTPATTAAVVTLPASSDAIYQPPTPPKRSEHQRSVTPDYKVDYEPPKTPEYDSNTGSIKTPPSQHTPVSEPTPSSQSSTDTQITAVASVPKIICLKKVHENNDVLTSPAPKLDIKSLTDILREQALKSMKRNPTPEPTPHRTTPDPDPRRTPTDFTESALDRSATNDACRLADPFADIDSAIFVSDDDSQGELDNYTTSLTDKEEDDLLDMISEPQITFKIKPKKKKEHEKHRLKEEKKKSKEIKRQFKEARRIKKIALKNKAALKADSENSVNGPSPKLNVNKIPGDINWQRKMITSIFADTKANTAPPLDKKSPDLLDEVDAPSTPEEQLLLEETPDKPTSANVRVINKKSRRKVIILNPAKTAYTRSPIKKVPAQSPRVSTSSAPAVVPAVKLGTQFPQIDSSTPTYQTGTGTPGYNPFAPSKPQQAEIPTSKLTTKPSGVKNIRKIKAVPRRAASEPVPAPVEIPKQTPPPPASEVDDFEKELQLLNAALDVPITSTSRPPPAATSQYLMDNDDDLLADIEEILNEERRLLE